MLELPVPWLTAHPASTPTKKVPQHGIGVVLATPVAVTATVVVRVGVREGVLVAVDVGVGVPVYVGVAVMGGVAVVFGSVTSSQAAETTPQLWLPS